MLLDKVNPWPTNSFACISVWTLDCCESLIRSTRLDLPTRCARLPKQSSTARGSLALIWPRQGKGNATVQLNITGGLDQITMAHIYQVRSLLPVVAQAVKRR